VALKRIEKASDALSREYEILQMIQGCNNIVKIEVWLACMLGLLLLQERPQQGHPKHGVRVCGEQS
jgi:hypothetical protein